MNQYDKKTIARFITSAQHVIGLDGAIAYTVLARLANILGSTGTVLLIVHFLGAVEQGYYYSLISLVNLQVIFELGFAFVIQQFAAHESVHLNLTRQGVISGDTKSINRLSLVLRRALKWYLLSGALLGLTLTPIGVLYFEHQARVGSQVHWQGPWIAAVLGCVVIFVLDPLFAFLDGCGWFKEVAAMRFGQAMLGIGMAWTTFLTNHGLFSPAMVIIGNILAGCIFLFRFRKLLLALLFHRPPPDAISWRSEIWSFQWRIAVSWLSTYFTAQVFVPALFLFRNPIEAGRMGMSLSIGGYMWQLVLAWISTKATTLGQMVARRDFEALDQLFLSAMRRALAIMGVLILGCLAGIIMLRRFYPRLAARMINTTEFCLLLLAVLCMFVIQCLAVYLRANKREPFLVQAPATALANLVCVFLFVPRWGLLGATAAYFLSAAGIGLPWALMVFNRTRRSYREMADSAAALSMSSNSALLGDVR